MKRIKIFIIINTTQYRQSTCNTSTMLLFKLFCMVYLYTFLNHSSVHCIDYIFLHVWSTINYLLILILLLSLLLLRYILEAEADDALVVLGGVTQSRRIHASQTCV